MNTSDEEAVAILGLGAMGQALASAVVRAGHRTTVWNRSPGKAAALIEDGAIEASTVGEAIEASRIVVVCLLDHDSVREVLDPVAPLLSGRAVVNLTTTTPEQSRMASLYDLAMLAGMYVMFAGFMHGAATVGSEDVSATEFADRLAPFLAAMTEGLAEYAEVIDGGDYSVDGQQSLEFSDLGDLIQATVDQGVSTEVVAPVQALIRRQIDAGHGTDGFARIYEGIRKRAS